MALPEGEGVQSAPARGPVVFDDGDVVGLRAGIPGSSVAEAMGDMRGVTDLSTLSLV